MKKTLFCFILFFAVGMLAENVSAQIGTRSTGFRPNVNGFKFSNTFKVEVINDVRLSGFCGGMVYSALDYYKAKKPIPSQNYRPANGTTLYNYVWGRQRSSVIDNLDKWTELTVNPFGWRSSEFFNWGLQGFNGGRLQELKTEIDMGNPVPIGLFRGGNGGMNAHHQVLAIGYKGGRYKGDLGDYQEDLEISVYDPNFPNVIKILKANTAKQIYYYKDEPNNDRCQWVSYFVDRKYRGTQPPTITESSATTADGLVDELLLEITTGGDDLRGGNDNVSVSIQIKGQPTQNFSNINKGARWINNYTETVSLKLRKPVKKEDIISITFKTSFGGGIGGDNWNMNSVSLKTKTGESLVVKSGNPLVRFDGNNKPYTITIK